MTITVGSKVTGKHGAGEKAENLCPGLQTGVRQRDRDRETRTKTEKRQDLA